MNERKVPFGHDWQQSRKAKKVVTQDQMGQMEKKVLALEEEIAKLKKAKEAK